MNFDEVGKDIFNNIPDIEMFKTLQKDFEHSITSDLKKIESLKHTIKNYDIYDFINSVSALNLIPNNQSKSVIFNVIISTALSIPKEEINFSNKMSMSNFRKIIKDFEDLDIKRNIDPAEFPFLSKIIFYKNYNLFMGVSTLSANSIQVFLNGLRDKWEELDKNILNKLNTNIELLLNVSTDISQSISHGFYQNKEIPYDNPILIPSNSELENLKSKLIFSSSYLAKYRFDIEEYDNLFCELNCCKNNNSLDFDNQYYFLHPLLKNGDVAIILDVTLFPLIIMHKLIALSLQNKENINLVDEYSKNTIKEVRECFKRLGNSKIKEESINLKLINSNKYQEVLYNTGNSGVIINIFVIDNGENFDNTKLISDCNGLIKMEYIEERLKIICDKLILSGAKEDNIFVVITGITIGRTMMFSLPYDYKYIIYLSPYEIRAISINESDKNLFLQRYMIAKSKLQTHNHNSFSELNLIVQYISSDYSFYFDDRLDVKKSMMMYVGEFSAEYIYKAEQKINEHLVPSYKDNYNSKVIKNENNIYLCDNHFYDKKLNLCIVADKLVIWLLTEQIQDSDMLLIYRNILDLLSFWINEYIGIINSQNINEEKLIIEIKTSKPKELFFKNEDTDKNIKDIVNLRKNDNNIVFNVVPELIWKLNYKNNKNEKEIFICFIKQLSDLLKINLYDSKEIERIFLNPYKKKAVALDYSQFSYLKPFSNRKERVVSSSDINILLDEIGLYVKNDLKYKYGTLDRQKNDELSKIIVAKLYNEIYGKLKACNKELTLKLLYYESERIMANMMIQKNSYKYNIACYPNHKADIDERFNEANKASLGIKFLIELLSSLQSTGKELLDEYEFEFLLAKSFHLIEWAYRNDLYHYNIIKKPMELLKSNRIGMKHQELEKTEKSFMLLREEQMGTFDKGKLQEVLNTFEKEKLKSEDLDNAFKIEFRFSIENLFKFFWFLIEYGENTKSEIHEMKISDILIQLKDKVPSEEIKLILDQFSLIERIDFLNPPKPFRREDSYPWRFNRNLSFTRKPLVKIKETILWGNRNLSNSIFFLFDLINDGKLQANTKEMKDYISKVNNLRGKNFNNLVFEYINTIDNLIVDKNVKKVNNLKIEDDNKNSLGDIDILYINLKNKRIVLVEAKDFNFVKNYYELYNEYQRLFLDTDDKKCFLSKHKRRVEWAKNHIKDIIQHYSLEEGNWQVTYMFITSEHCTANESFDMREKIYSINEINEHLLKNIR